MTCQEVDELAAAYALGALPPNEREEVRRHLAECQEHDAAMADARAIVQAFDVSVEEIAPPAHLRSKVLEAVLASDPPAPVAKPSTPSANGWRFGGFSLRPSLLVPVLGVLVAGLLAWNLALQFGGDSADAAFVRYMQNGDDVHGWVYYVEEVGVITVENLSVLPEGETYHAWATLDGELHSLGDLPVSPQGDAYILLTQHVTEDTPVWITVEPSDGDPAPSGRKVLSTED